MKQYKPNTITILMDRLNLTQQHISQVTNIPQSRISRLCNMYQNELEGKMYVSELNLINNIEKELER